MNGPVDDFVIKRVPAGTYMVPRAVIAQFMDFQKAHILAEMVPDDAELEAKRFAMWSFYDACREQLTPEQEADQVMVRVAVGA